MNIIDMSNDPSGCNDVEVTNVVVTFHLGVCINQLRFLRYLREHGVCGELGGRLFARVTINLYGGDIPPAKVFIFASGKCLLVGAKLPSLANASAHLLCHMLRNLGIPATVNNFRVPNIASYFPFNRPVDLHKVCAHDPSFQYMRGRFPGATRRRNRSTDNDDDDDHISCTIYQTGGVVLAGARHFGEIPAAARFGHETCAACIDDAPANAAADAAMRLGKTVNRSLDLLGARNKRMRDGLAEATNEDTQVRIEHAFAKRAKCSIE